MPRNIEVGGVDYGPTELRDLAQTVVPLRNAALKANRFDWSVSLTHVIGVLNTFAQHMEEESNAAD